MPLSKEQLREVQRIVEQWRRPSLRDAAWEDEIVLSRAELLAPRPPASDLKLDKLERALLSYYRAAAKEEKEGNKALED